MKFLFSINALMVRNEILDEATVLLMEHLGGCAFESFFDSFDKMGSLPKSAENMKRSSKLW